MGLPDCQFGPLLNFLGWWLPPGSKGGGDKAESEALPSSGLLASSSTPDEPNQLATLDDPAAYADEPSPEPSTAADSRVPALADGPFCVREGWYVEQVAAGKTGIWPPDLYKAQVAARSSGAMK